MPKAWQLFPQHSEDLITQLLFNRGLKTPEEIEKFFHPKLSDYESILKISHISDAKKRILQAIEKQELMIVYGDYDVDGVCATAIVYKALSSLGAKILPYIPHREKEGYGLSKLGLDDAKERGASLVITVDHGIVAHKWAKYAKQIGLDLIITDHHLRDESAENLEKAVSDDPECLALIHSTKMCGSGVAWCLMRSMIDEKFADELLEFVAVATICDSMPLIGVNRALVTEGLKKLNQTKCPGILALLNASGVTPGTIDSYVVGHMIGPRINAIGRLEHALDALRLLCTRDNLKAIKLATLLNQTNAKRQELTALAIEEARVHVDGTKNIYVLQSEKWLPGIIGLIAGRVAEESSRPVIAISVGEIYSKGSARSVDGINIVEQIRQFSNLLVDVGGHKGAAGFTIETKNLDQFRKGLEENFSSLNDFPEKTLEIEAEIPAKKLTKKLVRELNDFEPFGVANPKPVFCSLNMRVSDIRTLSEGKHLKFKADEIDCIAFGMGNLGSILQDGQLINVAYFLEINRFNGSENLQLKVRDINFES